MYHTTPFFEAFRPLLFGRPPRSPLAGLLTKLRTCSSLGDLFAACGSLIPDALLGPTQTGDHSRQRHYSLAITFYAFLAQVLSPDCACREIVRRVQAWHAANGSGLRLSNDTAAYCTARAKIALDTLDRIHRHLVERCQRAVGSHQLWRGREVKIVDGTTVSMPDTPANQKAYPQPSSQKPGCGFPILKLVGIFSLASGAVIAVAKGTLRIHESLLLRQIWDCLQRGDVVLADRGFCSYFALASLMERGIDSVMRLHQSRRTSLRNGRRLGPSDRIQIWSKPRQRPPGLSPEQFAAMPETLNVRVVRIQAFASGFRTRSFTLVTTLLDPVAFPLDALGELYLQRWGVELHFREIKTTMAMEVLRCQSPHMIHRELLMHLIAYNIVRSLMQQSASRHQADLARISFKGALDTLRHWANLIDSKRGRPKLQAQLIDEMLRIIAEDLVPLRPGRSEPRAVKRRPKNYHRLTKPRHQMGNLPHRNRPGKSRRWPNPKSVLS